VSALEPEFIHKNHASRATTQDDRELKYSGFRTVRAHVVVLLSAHGQHFTPRRAAR
jgi:hypothetical protein